VRPTVIDGRPRVRPEIVRSLDPRRRREREGDAMPTTRFPEDVGGVVRLAELRAAGGLDVIPSRRSR